jgi:hypothetical protein
MQHLWQKGGQLGLLDASPEKTRGGGQSADLVGQYIHQFGLRIWPAIGEVVLEVVPDAFVGVQFRSVRREGHEVKAARASEEFLHRIAAMDGAVIQQHDQMTPDLTQEMAQEDDDLFALNVVRVKQAV